VVWSTGKLSAGSKLKRNWLADIQFLLCIDSKLFSELSPFQEQLLIQLDERRKSGRAVAELFNVYADAVIRMAPTSQASLFGQDNKMSQEEALRTALKKIGGTWVDLQHWSAAQRVISGLDIPASQIQRLTPAQQRKAMKIAILS
jgi:hypothetical protein